MGLGTTLRHAWHVEYDKHPSAILAHRFPGVPNYGDVKTTDWASLEPVDWLTAGYPCQPFSLAGLRLGEDDPRHLWPGVAHAIGVLRPRRILLENVSAHLRVGFPTVLADLADLGYDASWGVVRASDAGAPHARARLFIVARDTDSPASGERRVAAPRQAEGGRSWPNAGGSGRALPAADPEVDRWGPRGLSVGEGAEQPVTCVGGDASADTSSDRRGEGRAEPARLKRRPDVALGGLPASPDPDSDGRGGLEEQHRDAPARVDGEHRGHPDGRGDGPDWGAYSSAVGRWEQVTGRPAPRPTQPSARGGGERLSPAFVEWMMGLPAGWVTDVPGLPRNAQLKALGNGVVPQQAALAVRLLVPAPQERAGAA